MKLRNKKTGEIKEYGTVGPTTFSEGGFLQAFAAYDSLAALNEDWEDYEEESKDFWYIEADGRLVCEPSDDRCKFDNDCRKIGNHFGTKEEAEKAVEKLKAWKRLRDKGIKVIDRGWEKINNINREDDGVIYIKVLFDTKTYDDSWDDDLDLLFGGEE